MATLNVQGKEIEVESKSYLSADYEIVVGIKTPDTGEGMLTMATIPVAASGRRDLTFDRVQEEIDEYFKERDIEVLEVTSVRVKEIQTFKSGWADD